MKNKESLSLGGDRSTPLSMISKDGLTVNLWLLNLLVGRGGSAFR